MANARHAIRDGDGCKTFTTTKSITSNARHAVRDGDRLKVAATFKGILFNARHVFRDNDRLKAGTIPVFANHFISEIYVLNGRKVVT